MSGTGSVRTVPTPPESAPAAVRDSGPAGWLVPFLEARYTRMGARQDEQGAEEAPTHAEDREAALRDLTRSPEAAAPAETGQQSPLGVRSRLQPGRGAEVFADVGPTYWHDLIGQYRQRQLAVRRETPARLAGAVTFRRAAPPMPGIPGTSNWVPVGPSVVRRGQPTNRPAISGRASGIAIAPGGARVYVATADGGVWRSDDGGDTWLSTMENFDIDPTTFAVTSLACGAIAIDEAQPDRVYVGTGEGDTNALFSRRVIKALPSYRGVGPLYSDNGGGTWYNEATDPSSLTLKGAAFFQLAVDPGDRERVVAATNVGVYRREPNGARGHHWVQKRPGVHSSVVVARSGGTTTFFAGAWGDRVYSSSDGSTWTPVGTGFPTNDVARIGLAVRRTSTSVLYALVANAVNEQLDGVYRLDGGTGAWKKVSINPTVAPQDPFELGSQCDYDLAIAVDPNNANRIFLGGAGFYEGHDDLYDAALYRGAVSSSDGAYSMTTTLVGAGTHADVHALVYAPGKSDTLWCCCDGGVFRTTSATSACTFEARNSGLATLSANFLALYPPEPAVMLCGFQDNGTGRYTGEECWTNAYGGDGGYPVINWADPRRVLVFANGHVLRATDGGQDYPSFAKFPRPLQFPDDPHDRTPPGEVILPYKVKPKWWVMAQPLVEAPPSPTPSDAEIVAYGAGPSIYLTTDFGSTWSTLPPLPADADFAFCITFASATRFYVGTTGGRVFRYDGSGTTWSQTPIPLRPATAQPLVTDIAVDPADPTGLSIFVALGGAGDYQHVWHVAGASSSWEQRSGPSPGAMTSLLDVEHNALVVDGSTLYVGADIGVWRSTDGGRNWAPLENGLPDAAVLDLQLHGPSRRLFAALHGRGVYGLKLDPPAPADVELYIRDTTLDLGLAPTADGRDDPATSPPDITRHWNSPNIKVDVPTPAGWQTPGTDMDLYFFTDKLVDGSDGVATLDPADGTVTNRVYVEVHNRGIAVAGTVRVMLLIADAFAGGPLPAGYTANVQAGTPISSAPWRTVGTVDVTNLRVGVPRVVEFDLPSTMLTPPASLPGHAHFCALALLHSAQDVFSATETDADALTVHDRKVAQKNLHLVQFPPGGASPGEAGTGRWVRVLLGANDRRGPRYELLDLDLRRLPARLGLLAPEGALAPDTLEEFEHGDPQLVQRWASDQRRDMERMLAESRFDRERIEQMIEDVDKVDGQPLFLLPGGRLHTLPTGARLHEGSAQPLFLRLAGPSQPVHTLRRHAFTVTLRARSAEFPAGGSTYQVQYLPPEPAGEQTDEGGEQR